MENEGKCGEQAEGECGAFRCRSGLQVAFDTLQRLGFSSAPPAGG